MILVLRRHDDNVYLTLNTISLQWKRNPFFNKSFTNVVKTMDFDVPLTAMKDFATMEEIFSRNYIKADVILADTDDFDNTDTTLVIEGNLIVIKEKFKNILNCQWLGNAYWGTDTKIDTIFVCDMLNSSITHYSSLTQEQREDLLYFYPDPTTAIGAENNRLFNTFTKEVMPCHPIGVKCHKLFETMNIQDPFNHLSTIAILTTPKKRLARDESDLKLKVVGSITPHTDSEGNQRNAFARVNDNWLTSGGTQYDNSWGYFFGFDEWLTEKTIFPVVWHENWADHDLFASSGFRILNTQNQWLGWNYDYKNTFPIWMKYHCSSSSQLEVPYEVEYYTSIPSFVGETNNIWPSQNIKNKLNSSGHSMDYTCPSFYQDTEHLMNTEGAAPNPKMFLVALTAGTYKLKATLHIPAGTQITQKSDGPVFHYYRHTENPSAGNAGTKIFFSVPYLKWNNMCIYTGLAAVGDPIDGKKVDYPYDDRLKNMKIDSSDKYFYAPYMGSDLFGLSKKINNPDYTAWTWDDTVLEYTFSIDSIDDSRCQYLMFAPQVMYWCSYPPSDTVFSQEFTWGTGGGMKVTIEIAPFSEDDTGTVAGNTGSYGARLYASDILPFSNIGDVLKEVCTSTALYCDMSENKPTLYRFQDVYFNRAESDLLGGVVPETVEYMYSDAKRIIEYRDRNDTLISWINIDLDIYGSALQAPTVVKVQSNITGRLYDKTFNYVNYTQWWSDDTHRAYPLPLGNYYNDSMTDNMVIVSFDNNDLYSAYETYNTFLESATFYAGKKTKYPLHLTDYGYFKLSDINHDAIEIVKNYYKIKLKRKINVAQYKKFFYNTITSFRVVVYDTKTDTSDQLYMYVEDYKMNSNGAIEFTLVDISHIDVLDRLVVKPDAEENPNTWERLDDNQGRGIYIVAD